MRWLRRLLAAWWGRPPEGSDGAEDGRGWLSYDELISGAGGEDAALDARLRQSAERISRQHEDPDED